MQKKENNREPKENKRYKTNKDFNFNFNFNFTIVSC